MTQSGWRKPTPALGLAEKLAQDGEHRSIAKTQGIVAVKRVGVHLGLKAADMLLLDTLAAFTQSQDWEAGQRPIVWASNAYLMTQTGFSLSTLKRHSRRLAQAGILAFQDSPNGKRWGHRDSQGRIVEAYGFDLSPICARVAEFEQLAAQLATERSLCQRLKRQITVTRRRIRAQLDVMERSETMQSTRTKLVAEFDSLLHQLPRKQVGSEKLATLLDTFLDLAAVVHQVSLTSPDTENHASNSDVESVNPTEMTPMGVKNEPHLQDTNQLNHVMSKSDEVTSQNDTNGSNKTGAHLEQAETNLTLPMILQACPEFSAWADGLGTHLRTWQDLVKAAGLLRPMIGISQRVWAQAQSHLGLSTAAAALALVLEKVHAGEVTSPSGYLRGMVNKAGAGELYLERSFWGRIAQITQTKSQNKATDKVFNEQANWRAV